MGLIKDVLTKLPTGFATVLGNRTGSGNVIAGDVFIEKGREVANGMVTFIDHTQGYLRIDGIVGATLSVRALTKLSTAALYLETQVP